MLVKVDDRAELSAAEREFVECLRQLPSTGLAIVDLRVGTQRGTRQVGAVVWTPQGILVVEVIGFRSKQSGMLTVSTERPWRVGDTAADLDLELGADPVRRVESALREVQLTFERASYDPGHLCGAVALIPQRGAVLRPARETLRPGLDVVVGNTGEPTELRIFLENFAPGPPRWTLGRVCAATRALTGWAPDRDELIAAGFEDKLPEPPKKPRTWPLRRPDSRRAHDLIGWVVLGVAVLGMLTVLAAIAGSLITDGPAAEPAAPSSSADPTVPPPTGSAECWPLQTDC
ncbi:NERD domain-containing protein [Nocardia speluncae]|uniref:NERD domain-containing protein n=1 Tax=Nocardia speluncae TaxID=419477 RepID=A0A846XM67_9NOCA|nr:nuclease-related domain-containing protein [Nocardia speluncae]NKY37418.1 NERD domain-containing protein [Nocardia speluncae]